MTKTPIHRIWVGMRQRCNDPGSNRYAYYGGRGISYEKRWEDFLPFYKDMSPTWFEGATLERVKNDEGYSKANCKWATRKEQARNRRTNRVVEVYGESMSLAEAIERFSVVPSGTVATRFMRDGWNIVDALTTPSRSARAIMPAIVKRTKSK